MNHDIYIYIYTSQYIYIDILCWSVPSSRYLDQSPTLRQAADIATFEAPLRRDSLRELRMDLRSVAAAAGAAGDLGDLS